MDIQDSIIRVIARINALPKESIKLKDNLKEDLGMDSLDIIEMIVELEREFNLYIPEGWVKKIKTVDEIVEYVKVQSPK
ncbi:MAG: acyl carrier protein [Cytophagaceae bacterium]